MIECGLTNLATCLPEKFFEFMLSMLGAPIAPLLELIKGLLTEAVNINIFFSLWTIIVYIISLFYGLFFIFAGFNFMISGYNSSRRENAKVWMRNIILMIIFIQGSFFIYDLIIEINALLSAGVIGLIDPNFFLLTADSFASMGLQLSLVIPYLIVLVLTIILLGLRYLLVSIGVVLFPFAIFFYFIPPLQQYGKMILNVLLVVIFVAFFDAVILFGASALIGIPIFANFSIVVAIVAFLTIDLLMIYLVIFALIKSATSVMNSDVGTTVSKAIKYII